MKKIIEKASVLVEALPYIKSFQGKTIVVKYGGSALEHDEALRNICLDLVFLKCVGVHPVLVHGGGKDISREMQKRGKKPEFIHGIRITDKETVGIAVSVMKQINQAFIKLLASFGGEARGFVGRTPSGTLLRVKKHFFTDAKGGSLDLGYVGDISRVEKGLIQRLHRHGSTVIPVIGPIGTGKDSQSYNINADSVASAVAVALKAHKLVLLTDVRGILRDPGNEDSLLSSLRTRDVNRLIDRGVISKGMVPKVRACVKALLGGVNKAHIIDGRVMHSILLEIFTDKGIGTEIVI